MRLLDILLLSRSLLGLGSVDLFNGANIAAGSLWDKNSGKET